jgi:hypothetical protein
MKRKFKRRFSNDFKLRILLSLVFIVFTLLCIKYTVWFYAFITGFGSLIFLSLAFSMNNKEKFK